MSSRFYKLDDDRELAPAPIFLTCDVCGAPVVLTDDDEDDDEPVMCLTCANAQARQARKSA